MSTIFLEDIVHLHNFLIITNKVQIYLLAELKKGFEYFRISRKMSKLDVIKNITQNSKP